MLNMVTFSPNESSYTFGFWSKLYCLTLKCPSLMRESKAGTCIDVSKETLMSSRIAEINLLFFSGFSRYVFTIWWGGGEEISEIWIAINEADKQLASSCDYHQCGRIKTILRRGHAECELVSAYQLLVQRRMLPLNRTSRCAAVWPPSCQTSWQSAAWRSRWRKRRHPPWEERGSEAEHSMTLQLTLQ